MNKWIVKAIYLAYDAVGQPSPMAAKAHSMRSMAAFKVLLGASLQEVCDVVCWSSLHSFVRFYDLDLVPGAHVLVVLARIHTRRALVSMAVNICITLPYFLHANQKLTLLGPGVLYSFLLMTSHATG